MSTYRPLLSKSKLIAAWQCTKRLHLQKHFPELAEISAATESLWSTGQQVGEVAKQLYGSPDAIEIGFDKRVGLLVARTRELIESGVDVPIFEATFQFENVLVRVDVLLPDDTGWRAIEVKASTSVKDYHVLDCAIQYWVMRGAGIDVTSMSLAHIDNRFVYPGDKRYAGLLAEHDVSDQVSTLETTVLDLVAKAREAVSGPMPLVTVGTQCSKPYDCEFSGHCWPHDTEYPLAGLGGSKAKLGQYAARGCRDIRDVGADDITAETQRRIQRITSAGEPEILEGAGRTLAALPYPRYYLDFETIAPAVPFWPGARPYAPLPVQWSCHIDDGASGGSAAEMSHQEFLDLSGELPVRALALALVECLGDAGPVLMYTDYEQKVIERLIDLYPDLAAPLARIIDRLVDLHPIVKQNYYHPRMLGSWSIKAVMPTINADMDYARLEGIHNGTAASDGFVEAIDPMTSRERRAELEVQLRRYCRFDTESMVEIVRFFSASERSV
jgi:hypothetical protein